MPSTQDNILTRNKIVYNFRFTNSNKKKHIQYFLNMSTLEKN